jgi:4-amino-4-deoxy-L-arabinose transferase-like glycosyltransferase
MTTKNETGPRAPFLISRALPSATATHLSDRLAVAVLIGAAAIALLMFRDYGLGWDDYTHAEYGDLLVAFFASGFRDQRALSWVNLYMYGGGFDLIAALAAKILPFTVFETRRLMGGLVGLIGLLAVWRTARRIGGPPAGLLASVLLATCPLYVGQVFINAKDGPFAVAMAILLLGLVRTFEQYPQPSLATRALAGIGFGLAIGSRVMGAFGAMAALGALAFLFAIEARADGVRIATFRLGHFVLAMLPVAVLAIVVMAVWWPWSVAEPFNLFRAAAYFSHFFEKPWHELYGGALVLVTEMPRSYVPTLFALQLPVTFSALAAAGTIGALIAASYRGLTKNRRAVLLLVTLFALLPIAITLVAHPALYNGIRHFIFVLPPLAVLGGVAGAWLFDWLKRFRHVPAMAAVILVFAIALPIVDMVRLHPYEYTYFNRIAGGVRAARANYMLDYWGLSLKQASQALAQKLAERHETRPQDRHWKLAVCGPHRSPQVELGPDFDTSWDPKGADFAMMLGEFYCQTFDAPVLAEIVRGGVVYARVYDIRGRSYPSLLTIPEP